MSNRIKKLNKSIKFFKLRNILLLFLKFIKNSTLDKVNFILIFINKIFFINFN